MRSLSAESSTRLDVALPGGTRYTREMTREQFEALAAAVIQRTAAPCRQALKDAGLATEQIDEVVLVGGSTRIPAVQTLVNEHF